MFWCLNWNKRIIISISSQQHIVHFIQLQMKIAIDSPHNIAFNIHIKIRTTWYISTKCCQLNSYWEYYNIMKTKNENCSPSLFTFFNWNLTLVHIYSYIYNALYVQSKHMQMSNHAINYSRREHNPFLNNNLHIV